MRRLTKHKLNKSFLARVGEGWGSGGVGFTRHGPTPPYLLQQTMIKKFINCNVAILLAATLTLSSFTGCQLQTATSTAGQPTASLRGDPILINAQRTIVQAKTTALAYVHLERDYEDQLAKVSPDFHKYAEKIRGNLQQWLRDGWDAIEAYRTSKDASRLNQAISVLQSVLDNSQHYINEAKTEGVTSG
jgi:uncharacterized lipoprotein YajG